MHITNEEQINQSKTQQVNRIRLRPYTGWTKKMFQHENYDISEIRKYFCTKFCPFVCKTTVLCKSLLLCDVFTWHTPNWRKRKLQERILQLHRRLTL